ncbi:MAG: glycerol-3-phosphate dehydrogenase/oxidase [Planctomycetota bacterium]|nr:glycerol-3-phosphate dehydrogenase/oxidase [Planctomycetota bacterium]
MLQRQRVLDQVRRQPGVAVLIVGGGINGCGLFRDLTLQGVRVLLVDKSDFCSGASAAPSRMIHGGLRYLEFGEFRLVREALKDRNLLLQNARHYVFPLPTTIPIFAWLAGVGGSIRRFLGLRGPRSVRRGALMVKLGLTFYDVFTRKSRLMPRHKFTSRAASLARRPQLHPAIVRTATYYDAWIAYPERLGLELLLDGEASCPQAQALNYVSLQAATGDTVSLRDELSGEVLVVRPQVVVNATGGWIDFTNHALGHQTRMIGGTKGAHLVLDNPTLYETLQGEMIYYETADGRVAIALPWLGRALIGSTDVHCGNPDDVRVTEQEIDYILESIRRVLPEIDVNQSQILSYFTGVRPMKSTAGAATVEASRDHECAVLEPTADLRIPVCSMIGGKWTTFRAFAEQVTDRLLDRLGQSRRAGTEQLAIGGGKDYPQDELAKQRWLTRLHEATGLSPDRLTELLNRYGTRAEAVTQFLAGGPDEPLRQHAGYSRREIEFLVRHEKIVRLDDLVLRRTAIALLGELTGELLQELTGIVAPLLGWSNAVADRERRQTAKLLRDRYGLRSLGPDDAA